MSLDTTILPPPPETLPAPPMPSEQAVAELWCSVIEESRITLRPSWLPEEEPIG